MTGASADGWAMRGIEEARALLGGGSWEATILHGTGGGVFGSSVARLRSGSDSMVVKVLRRNDAGPGDPASWRRELDLYRSAWLADLLPDGLAVPECVGWTITEEAAVILMEDVLFDDRDARPVEWYGRLADGLGQLVAAPVDDVPPWASRGFVASEASRLALAAPGMAASPSPHIAELVVEWRPMLERLLVAAPTLLAQLDLSPHGFNHLDAFSRNAAEVGDRMVLIDWAYAGLAPIGTDAAAVVAITGLHGDVDRDRLEDLYRSVVDGFTTGLAAAGRDLDVDQVEAAIQVLLTLRWAGFLAHAHGVGDGLIEVAESVLGRPFDESLRAWFSLSELVMPMAEAVLSRIDS